MDTRMALEGRGRKKRSSFREPVFLLCRSVVVSFTVVHMLRLPFDDVRFRFLRDLDEICRISVNFLFNGDFLESINISFFFNRIWIFKDTFGSFVSNFMRRVHAKRQVFRFVIFFFFFLFFLLGIIRVLNFLCLSFSLSPSLYKSCVVGVVKNV